MGTEETNELRTQRFDNILRQKVVYNQQIYSSYVIKDGFEVCEAPLAAHRSSRCRLANLPLTCRTTRLQRASLRNRSRPEIRNFERSNKKSTNGKYTAAAA